MSSDAQNGYLLAYAQVDDDCRTFLQSTETTPRDYLVRLETMLAATDEYHLIHMEAVTNLDRAWQRLAELVSAEAQRTSTPVDSLSRAWLVGIVRKVAREFPAAEPQSSWPQTGEAGSAATSTDRGLEEFLRGIEDQYRDLFLALRERTLSLGEDITERVRTRTIAYATERVFLEIRFQRNGLRLLMLDIRPFESSLAVETVPESHGWGLLNQKVILAENADLQESVELVRSSYVLSKGVSR